MSGLSQSYPRSHNDGSHLTIILSEFPYCAQTDELNLDDDPGSDDCTRPIVSSFSRIIWSRPRPEICMVLQMRGSRSGYAAQQRLVWETNERGRKVLGSTKAPGKKKVLDKLKHSRVVDDWTGQVLRRDAHLLISLIVLSTNVL